MFLTKQQCLSAKRAMTSEILHCCFFGKRPFICRYKRYRRLHFYAFSHAGNTFSKAWKEKFTVVYRQLLRKFRAFSNQNRRILHVPDKSVIPLRSWREQHDLCYVLAVNRLMLINRDLMLPTSSLFFITRPEDRQVLPEEFEEGWFGQPKYSTNVCVNSRFYRFRLKK